MPGPVDAIDRAARQIGEVQAALPINRDVVWSDEWLALIVVGEHFYRAGAQVGPRDPRHEFPQLTGSLRIGALAGNQAALRIDEQAIGIVAVLAERGQHALRAQFHDALSDQLCEVHVAVLVDGWPFRERQRRGDLERLRDAKRRHRQTERDR